jgi:hypothetical protein
MAKKDREEEGGGDRLYRGEKVIDDRMRSLNLPFISFSRSNSMNAYP